jgi:hypothetical protein
MITIEMLAPGVLKIVAPETADDFVGLAPQVESITKKRCKIRLLLDASRLEGWGTIAALEAHATFVKRMSRRWGASP